MSDTDDSFNFLISMCYTQLFNLLCEKADDVYGGRLPVHVRCLIDECANIGQIPKLEKLVATIRSREISACLVLQAQSQLKAIYKDNADKVAQTDSTETALSIVREQLTELQLQQDKICEYLEKGIYTIEMFTKRNDTLTREIHKVQAAENELLKKQGAQKDIHDVEKEIIPTTQHILDSYPQLSVEEKNRLWKIVMERITAYRTPGGEVSIHIYPKLPMR